MEEKYLVRLSYLDRILRKLSPLEEKETVAWLQAICNRPGPILEKLEEVGINDPIYPAISICIQFLKTGKPELEKLLDIEEIEEGHKKLIKSYREYLEKLI